MTGLVDALDKGDVAACTNLLIVAVVGGPGGDSLAAGRGAPAPGPTPRARPPRPPIPPPAARIRAEFTAHTCRQNDDPAGQLAAFRRARALDCLLRATVPGLSREAFTDVVYEAAAAIGHEAVRAALSEYVPA